MKELWTVAPYGLNDKCEGKDWTKRDHDEIVAQIFHRINTKKRKSRSESEPNVSVKEGSASPQEEKMRT